MLSIKSSADMAEALAAPLDPTVRRLLTLRRDQLLDGTDADLGEFVHFIVARRGDTLAAVEAAANFPFATNPDDGTRWPVRRFVAPFEYVERTGGWLEAVTVLNDDGFALVLFAADCICTDPDLLSLLHRAMT